MKKIWAVLAALILVCGGCAAEDVISSATLEMETLPAVENGENGILVAYFSPDDTVRAAAYAIAAELSAELFEIEPAEPYTEDDLDYRNNKSRSMTEMGDAQARPEITALPEDLSGIQTVILCYPIWGGQAPKILFTFLEGVDLSGKMVIPFATSNSSGIGRSSKALQNCTGDSVAWEEGKGIKKGATEEEIRLWAASLELGK